MTNDTSLVEELEEDLRQERLRELWREYGPYIVMGVVLAILLTGIMSGWRAWNTKINTTQTATVIGAFENTDATVSADDLRAGPRALVWLNEGGRLLAAGKTEEARAVYSRAAADKDLPEAYRAMAIVMAVRLDWAATDRPEAQGLLNRLSSVMNDDKGPWQAQARLTAALIAGQGLGDYKTARGYLQQVIGTAGLPETLIQRAQALDRVMAQEQIKSPAVTDSPAAVPARAEEKPEG